MFRTKTSGFVLTMAAAALTALPALAASNAVTVPGVSDIWLAGQPNATSLDGGFGTPDVAPANSPVLASTGLNMTAGSFLTFSASGSTNFGGCANLSPDGNGPCGPFTAGANPYGLSGYIGPVNALVGIFIGNTTPGGSSPATVNFTLTGATTQSSYSPALYQVFFIGDGLTGTGTGATQQFIIPAGATRLYLASSDGVGASFNNSGSFSVSVFDAASAPPTTPIPNTIWLTFAGLLLLTLAGLARLRFRGVA